MSTIKSTYKFHKYADLYPLGTERDLQLLVEDIQKNGQTNSICLYDGIILDGRRRYIACWRMKIEPRFHNVVLATNDIENEPLWERRNPAL